MNIELGLFLFTLLFLISASLYVFVLKDGKDRGGDEKDCTTPAPALLSTQQVLAPYVN